MVAAYAGRASANSAVFGSKGLMNASDFDLLRSQSGGLSSIMPSWLTCEACWSSSSCCSASDSGPIVCGEEHSQSVQSRKLAENVRFVVLLVHVGDCCHFFYAPWLEVGRGEPLSIVRPIRLDLIS